MTHEHLFVVRDDFTRPDTGVRQVQRECVCGLSERRRYDGRVPLDVRYRYTGLGSGWLDAAEFLQLSLPVKLCHACGGSDPECQTCDGLRVTEPDGSPIGGPPKPAPVRR